MRMYLAVLLLTGCGFSLNPVGGPAIDASDGPTVDAPERDLDAAIDAPPPIDAAPEPLDIAHVAAADEALLTSTTDYTISTNVTINTGTGVISPAVPAGVEVRMTPQEGGGLALLVIQARRITVGAGVTVRITGTRGVVFVATEQLVVAGTLDASADRTTPGPGGYPSSNGPGAGPDASGMSGHETGGAGASFGSRGGDGGDCTALTLSGPTSALAYGTSTLSSLEGGSGGGNALASAAPGLCGVGGAGGGAIQLSAPNVTITGVVRAGGGGGDGGRKCNSGGPTDASSGAGGGAGGAIYIQAQSLPGAGWLVANGGGGGGGGCVMCIPGTGAPGEDGRDDATAAAGGTSPQTPTSFGGAGATAAAGQEGFPGSNAGGGGGGAGRIFLAVPVGATVAVNASPPAVR